MAGKTLPCIAWYRPQDWQRLRELADDPENIEDSHGQWLETANRTLRSLERRGIVMRKVIIDLDELMEFCRAHGLKNTTATRSHFAATKVREEIRND